jgi:hypothetical protein
MREFQDHEGRAWVAAIDRRPGQDFKGRYFFVAHPRDAAGEGGERVVLDDVRWNSVKTARRTLETMSDVELRRRLRSARGRAASPLFVKDV